MLLYLINVFIVSQHKLKFPFWHESQQSAQRKILWYFSFFEHIQEYYISKNPGIQSGHTEF